MYSFFDTHCDTLSKAFENKEELLENNLHLSLSHLKNFNAPTQFFAIWLADKFLNNAFEETVKRINYFHTQVEKNKNVLATATTYNHVLENKKNNKISGILSIEGGEALEGKIENLYTFHKLGVKAITLTWNNKNQLGYGAKFEKGGLTPFGFQVIEEMEKLNMIVDVSHLNDEGFWQVSAVAKKPFIASHSNSREITPIKRNLTDAQLKAVAEKGGVVGINLYPTFLTKNTNATLEDILKHIDHIINIIGSDHIGLGCDYDGIDTTPIDFENASCLVTLFKVLENKYGSSFIEKFTEGNFLRVLKSCS